MSAAAEGQQRVRPSRIVMLVASHKAYCFPDSSHYLPVHVGSAASTLDLGIQRDDSGDSISALNGSFCELTALYWAWKNLDADYYGLSHYRRYFRKYRSSALVGGRKVFDPADIADISQRFDVVLGVPRNYYIESVQSHYEGAHHAEDLQRLRALITTRHADILPSFNRVFGGTRISLYNMFVMRREHFQPYCRWLFEVLFALEPELPYRAYSRYQQRVFGFLAERLLNVWVDAHIDRSRVLYLPVLSLEGDDRLRKGLGFLKRKIKGGLDARRRPAGKNRS